MLEHPTTLIAIKEHISMIYLYIKQHSITGLKYFGKTIKSNPEAYKGSGKYWLNHIKKYGINNVETLGIWEFQDQEECTKFALKFSEENNIIESNQWANLILEDGITGYNSSEANPAKLEKNRKRMRENNPMFYTIFSEDALSRMSKATKGKPKSKEHKEKLSKSKIGSLNPNYGKPENGLHYNKRSICVRCGVETNIGNIKRWHNDNCKVS